MKSILRRTLIGGPATAARGELKRIIRRRARVLAMVVVVSMLVASLPPSFANTQDTRASNGPAQSISLPAQLYSSVSQSVASIGAWVAGIFTSTSPETIAYQPVAAYISPAPPFIDAPTNLTVTAASASSVSLSWTAPGGSVDHYQIERATNIEGPFFFLANVSGATTTHSDNTVTNLHAYLYRVRAVTSGGLPSAPSNLALGTAISFQFNELDNQEIKAQHFYDVRTAINLVRELGNLSAATWVRGNLAGLDVLADDVNELRTRLNEALTALSIPVTAYQDPTLQTGANGTWIHSTHLEQLQTRSTRGSSTSFGPLDSDSSTARLDPLNETGGGGENPLSRNFNWNLPLVSLPGRAGLNLGLSLSYNSLVWTRSGNTISFDDDNGFPAPGFRLGFPVIQQLYYNTEVGKLAFLLISPDGSRTELRQVGSSALYEAADSSHLLLDSSTMVLRTTEGTQLTYVQMGNEFNCTQIKDRNGNYITVNHTVAGRIDTVVDTLARSIKFNYDANGWLTSITQLWNQGQPSEVTHNWARFEYANVSIDYNFTGLTVFGPADNSTLKMLSRVKLADDSYFDFSYTSWGQAWKVSSFASDNHLLNHRSYNLPQTGGTAHTDCPRFTERRDWAQYWNGDTNGTTATNEEAVTTFAVPVGDTWTMPDSSQQTGTRAQVTMPDGTSNKIYFVGIAGTSSGWRRGLPALVNTYDGGGVLQRQAMTTWTQDTSLVSYLLNPRITERNVYDPAGNRARTEMTYQQFTFANGTSCHLPRDFYEYAANASDKLRSTRLDYNTSTTYTERRIIGLVSERRLYEGDVNSEGVLASKVAFNYDESGSIQGTDAPVQHDNNNYTASFVAGRGNLSSVKRYDVNNTSIFTTTSSKYNTSGAVVSSKDASNHEVLVSYSDEFSDNNSRNTLAYPTTVTDADDFSSTVKYNFDFGAPTYKRSPLPNVTTNMPGPERFFSYDSIGRPQAVTNSVNSASTGFVYTPSQNRVDKLSTIEDGLGAARAFIMVDGHGRVIGTATDLPNSTGLYSGQRLVYDVMGRVIKMSNPAETSASGASVQWTTAGDDEDSGWIFTEQTYDWKSRPLVTTNPSVTSNPSETTSSQVSYTGCGCAGGEVVTITDEGTIDANGVSKKRQRKIYSDVLGRTIIAENLNWDGTDPNGTGGSVYSSTKLTYNARDQIMSERQYAGPTSSTTFQEATASYDGFGRLKTQHLPHQKIDVNNSASSDHTTWNYNNDDTIQSVVDPRGVITNFTYNARHLPTAITFNSSSIPGSANVASTTSIAFAYDALGNRTSMSDGSGAVNYHYDQLSRMDWEERSFAGLPNAGAFRLNYEYSLGGVLKKVTDQHSGTSFTETLDKIGRVTAVSAIGFGGAQTQFISQAQYRAWGGLKSRSQGSTTLSYTYNQRLLVASLAMGAHQKSYEYHHDGMIKFADDDTGFGDIKDRAYVYDAAGRLQQSYSGVEARNYVNNTSGGTPDGPYRHAYTYDQWDNLLQNTGRFWSRDLDTPASFFDTDDRNPDWSYDASGNLISRNEFPTTMAPFQPARYKYDAAGREVESTQTRTYFIPEEGLFTHAFLNSRTLDGDNKMIHYSLARNTTSSNFGSGVVIMAEAYLLRSTVLGGRAISEYKGDGTWSKTHVYAGGERLGEQTTAEVGSAMSIWETVDPVTGDSVKRLASGSNFGSTTLDPGGVDVGDSDPFPADGSGDPDGFADGTLGKTVSSLIPIEGGGSMCILDGLEIECSRISGNSSVQCPNNDCGTRTVTFTARSNGRVVGSWTIIAPTDWDDSNDGTYRILRDGAQIFTQRTRQGPVRGTSRRSSGGRTKVSEAFTRYGKVTEADRLQALTAMRNYEDCIKQVYQGQTTKTVSGTYKGNTQYETKGIPDWSTAYSILAATGNNSFLAPMMAAIWSHESSFNSNPAGDTGPLQFTGYWHRGGREQLSESDLAWGDRLRNGTVVNNGLPYNGNLEDHLATGRNIIWYLYGHEGANQRAVYYGYGPGHEERGEKEKKNRSIYADQLLGLQQWYQPLFDCLTGTIR